MEGREVSVDGIISDSSPYFDSETVEFPAVRICDNNASLNNITDDHSSDSYICLPKKRPKTHVDSREEEEKISVTRNSNTSKFFMSSPIFMVPPKSHSNNK